FCSSSIRHTISKRDWSSDMCSSDLGSGNLESLLLYSCSLGRNPGKSTDCVYIYRRFFRSSGFWMPSSDCFSQYTGFANADLFLMIGRASCSDVGLFLVLTVDDD